MNYAELKKAYEESLQKCSELEKEIENKDLRIEHLTELLIKRNKMLFGQKSEKGKYICDGQLSLDGIVLNEAEEQSDFNVSEPTADTVIKKSKKTGKHRGRKEIRADLETKKVVYELPQDEQICSVCGEPLTEYTEEYLTTRLAVIPEKVYQIEYYRKVYKCKNCDKNGEKANIVKAENKTPACIIKKGLPDASIVVDTMQRKYQLGTPLDRQEKYWAAQGVYLSRTSMANWVIESSKWFEPVTQMLWKYSYKEPVLNADETTSRTLKNDKGEKIDKLGQMWI